MRTPLRFIMIRHAQTLANVAGHLDTAAPGQNLSPLGCQQAETLPSSLTSEPIAAVATSFLVRAQLTARPLARQRQLRPATIAGLEEIGAGSLEMRNDRESKVLYLQTGFAWSAGDLDRVMPGGANGHQFFKRFDCAMANLAARRRDASQTTAVLSHGAAIRVWLAARAVNIDVAFADDQTLGNTGRVVIERNDHGWEILSWDNSPIDPIPTDQYDASSDGAPPTQSSAHRPSAHRSAAHRSAAQRSGAHQSALSHPSGDRSMQDPTGASLTDLLDP